MAENEKKSESINERFEREWPEINKKQRNDRETAMTVIYKNIDAMSILVKNGEYGGLFYCDGYKEIVKTIKVFDWAMCPQVGHLKKMFYWLFVQIGRGKVEGYYKAPGSTKKSIEQFETLQKLCVVLVEGLKDVTNEDV